MLSIYVGCLLFGGVLVGASLVMDHDHGADGGGHDPGHGGDPHHGGAGFGALPIFSLRFWTFALTGFGLTGTALSLLGTGGALVPLLAAGMGLGGGYGASRLVGALARAPVGLLRGAEAHVGREGTLLLPVARGQRGKLRLEIGGLSTDFLAETDDDDALPTGTPVIVVGLRGPVALVTRSPAALRPAASPTKEGSS